MKILVVYYSMYGHVLQLARAVAQGASALIMAAVTLADVPSVATSPSVMRVTSLRNVR